MHEQVTFALYIDPTARAYVRCVALGVGQNRGGIRIEAYRADVVWRENGGRVWFVGDFKAGLITPEFQRKARWMEACGWPVEILRR